MELWGISWPFYELAEILIIPGFQLVVRQMDWNACIFIRTTATTRYAAT